MKDNYILGSIVEMKKPHPCGANEWEVIRMGADIRIKCCNCHRSILLTRRDFEKKLKTILK